jgi:hypothetical protein
MRFAVVFVGSRTIVWLGRAIQTDNFTLPDILEAVVDQGRDDDQLRLRAITENLIDLSFGRRIGAVIVEREACTSLDQAEMIGLQTVQMPALDNTGLGGRDVHLPEALEFGVVAAKNLKESPPVVGVDDQVTH